MVLAGIKAKGWTVVFTLDGLVFFKRALLRHKIKDIK